MGNRLADRRGKPSRKSVNTLILITRARPSSGRRRSLRSAGPAVEPPVRRRDRSAASQGLGGPAAGDPAAALLPGDAIVAVPIVDRPDAAGMIGDARVAVEKSFGHDLASARELSDRLRQVLGDWQLLLIDHFLGKEPVIEIEYLRSRTSRWLRHPMGTAWWRAPPGGCSPRRIDGLWRRSSPCSGLRGRGSLGGA
jgi:glucose-6-phosphate dehydrogenase-like protein